MIAMFAFIGIGAERTRIDHIGSGFDIRSVYILYYLGMSDI